MKSNKNLPKSNPPQRGFKRNKSAVNVQVKLSDSNTDSPRSALVSVGDQLNKQDK